MTYTTKEASFSKIYYLNDLNNFHPNIKLSAEVNPETFVDTKIILNEEGVVATQVYRKEKKKAVPWFTKILKRYKRNTISRDFYRSRNNSV